jgi:hypothetical protein
MILSAMPGDAQEYLKDLIHGAPGKGILVTVIERDTNCINAVPWIDLGWIPYEWIMEVFVENEGCIRVTYKDGKKTIKKEYFDKVMFVGDVFEWGNNQGIRINAKI